MILQIQNVDKSFSGKQVLHDVTFEVKSGRAMGFLGRNGAGKTTAIRALMNVFYPDKGEFLLDGKPFSRKDYKVGYLPEERGMYGKISIVDQLAYFGQLKGMERRAAVDSAKYWLEYMGLGEYGKKNLEVLSKGNQQKVQIIQTVIDDPDILILDEPFSGLDPVNSQVLKNLIRSFIEKERIVIFSSHQMSYVEEFCDDVTFIQEGKIVLSGDLEKIKTQLGENKIRLEAANLSNEELSKKITSLGVFETYVDKKSVIVQKPGHMTGNQFLEKMMEQEIEVERFEAFTPTLEEIFISLDSEKEVAEKLQRGVRE
ncbi:MAG: ATP-binding cassette domain-containing protein [Clostridiales bacterium]|nr:ATP-binding cassette domain-containing protein [Clostridiales bacterium]